MSKALDFSSMDSASIERFVNSVPKNYYKISNRFLFLPEMSSPKEFVTVASKMEQLAKEKKAEFEGNFRLRSDFGSFSLGDSVPFSLLDRKITVGQMKDQLSGLLDVSADAIKISFHSLRPIQDDFSLHSDLGCHGKGGENFWLILTPPSDSKRAE
ncbi:MAG: hypothetical protein KDK59_03840 [Simkania sp.]|nr:hypothetical protein [Simkania sp.]